MRRARLLAAGFTAIAATCFWWVAATPSQGSPLTASVVKVGWWSQQPGAAAQPEGGFQVTMAATGPQSVAAIEINLGEAQSVTSATLTLTEGGQSVRPDGAALQVCAVPSSAWKADNPGAWSDQPPSDCARTLKLERDAGSSSWKADISSLVSAGGTADVMVVPVANPVGGLADPGFQVTIAKAEVKADGTTSADSSSSTLGYDSSSSGTSGSTATSSSGSGATSSFPSSSGSSSAIAFPSTPAATSAAPVSPAAPSVATPAAPSAPAAPANPPAPLSGALGKPTAAGQGAHHSRPWGRLILFVPLAAAIGFGAALVKRSENLGEIPLIGQALGFLNVER